MTYTILSTRTAELTLITNVQFNFDGDIITVDIPHFMPKTQEEVEQNIINAAAGELAKKQAMVVIENLVPTLPINEEKPIE